jgi:hypothetical protein
MRHAARTRCALRGVVLRLAMLGAVTWLGVMLFVMRVVRAMRGRAASARRAMA